MEKDEDEVLTTADVAKFLKISDQMVRRLDIPKTQHGRIIRYQKKDVLAWMEANKDTIPGGGDSEGM